MKQKDKDILKAVLFFLISVVGSIIFFSSQDSFYELLLGIIFSLSGIGNLLNIVRLLTQKELSPEEKTAEVEKKLADIPRLETPCKISIMRPSNFLGAMNYVAVYLHGFEVGRLKNGMTLEFSTDYALNEMILQPEQGKGIRIDFPATADGHVRFEFDYKKGTITQI